MGRVKQLKLCWPNTSVVSSAFVILIIAPLPVPLLVPVFLVLLLLVLVVFLVFPAAVPPVCLLPLPVRPFVPVPVPIPMPVSFPVPFPVPTGVPIPAFVSVFTAVSALPPTVSVPPVIPAAPASLAGTPVCAAVLVAPDLRSASSRAGLFRIAIQHQIIAPPTRATACISHYTIIIFPWSLPFGRKSL